jgi:2'-5' RNA ligase
MHNNISYGWVGVYLPKDLNRVLKNWVKKHIPEAHLSDTESDNTDSHITIKYGLLDTPVKGVLNLIGEYPKDFIKVMTGRMSLFQNDNFDVLKIEVMSEDLKALNKLICEGLDVVDTHPDYIPHITLAYLKPGMGKLYAGNTIFQGLNMKLDDIEYADKDKNRYRGKLGDIRAGASKVQKRNIVKRGGLDETWTPEDAIIRGDGKTYSLPYLWQLASSMPVENVPMSELEDFLNRNIWYNKKDDSIKPTPANVFRDAKRIYESDLRHPILMAPSGDRIIDGIHRLAKAKFIEGLKEVPVIKFESWPDVPIEKASSADYNKLMKRFFADYRTSPEEREVLLKRFYADVEGFQPAAYDTLNAFGLGYYSDEHLKEELKRMEKEFGKKSSNAEIYRELLKAGSLSKVAFQSGQLENIKCLYKVAAASNSIGNFLTNVKDLFKNNWKRLAVTGAVVGAGLIGKKILNSAIDDVVTSKDFSVKNTEGIIRKAKAQSNIDIPHASFRTLTNAYYIPPGTIKEDDAGKIKDFAMDKIKSSDEDEREKGKVLLSTLEFSSKPGGGIIVGERFTNPHVVAHELGHAKIEQEGGLYRFMQKYAPVVQNVGLLTAAGSIVPSLFEADTVSKIMAGAGLGAFALGSVGEMLTEYKASNIAKDMLNNIDYNKKAKKAGENVLNLALGTYAAKNLAYGGGLAASAIMPPISFKGLL